MSEEGEIRICRFCDEERETMTMPTLATNLPYMCQECFRFAGMEVMESPWEWATIDDAEEAQSQHESESFTQGQSELTESNLDQHNENLQGETLRNATMRENFRDTYRDFVYDRVTNCRANRQEVLDYLEYHYRMYTPFFAEVAESEARDYEAHQQLAQIYHDALEEAGSEGRERTLEQLKADWGDHERYDSVANSEEVAWLRDHEISDSDSQSE